MENIKITGLWQSLATHRDPTLRIQRIYYESIFVWLADNIWLGILLVGNIWRSIDRTSIRRSIICFVCCCTLIWWCWSRWARLTKLEFFFFLNTLWFIQRRRRGMLLTIPERWLLTLNKNMLNVYILSFILKICYQFFILTLVTEGNDTYPPPLFPYRLCKCFNRFSISDWSKSHPYKLTSGSRTSSPIKSVGSCIFVRSKSETVTSSPSSFV